MILLRTISILVLLWGQLWAIDAATLMQSGNRAYDEGDYETALTNYIKILGADTESAELHYNLGCSYFKLKEYGEARLHFEKAKRLSPRDPDIAHNLEYSKLFLVDKLELPEPMPLVAWFTSLRQSLSLRELYFWETLIFIVLILGLSLNRVMRDPRFFMPMMTANIILGLAFFLSTGWLIDRSMALGKKQAVLLTSEANVSSAPVDGANTLFVIHEGTAGAVVGETDQYYELKLADGKSGWILQDRVGLY